MNGRTLFFKFQYVLRLISHVFGYAPKFVQNFLWDCFFPFRGVFACGIRYALLAAKGAKLGENVYIGHGVTLLNVEKLVIGSNVSIHTGCYIDAIGGVKIGDNVSIAHGVSLVSFNHLWSDRDIPIKYNDIQALPIRIDDDVWLGCGVRVLAGAELCKRSVVAAGAVVAGGKYENGVIAGVPAKRIKEV